jgi:hypothetical protein
MAQTRDDRIRAMWKARKYDARRESVHVVYMDIARTFKLPIREVREIIGRQHPADKLL